MAGGQDPDADDVVNSPDRVNHCKPNTIAIIKKPAESMNAEIGWFELNFK